MIPIRDTTPSKTVPVVNNTLIGINVVFFLVQLAQGPAQDHFVYLYGLVPAKLTVPPGYETIKDQFMLGNDILVAPVVEEGMRERKVVLPEGKWICDEGKVFEGGQTIGIEVPLKRLPYFKKTK